MGIHQSTYIFYGVLVAVHDPKGVEPHTQDIQSELWGKFGYDTEFVSNNVRHLTCGAYDRNDLYLVIDQDGYASYHLEPGQRRSFPSMTTHAVWTAALYETAGELGLTILDGPAWFTVADES